MGNNNRTLTGVTLLLLVGLGVSACSTDDDTASDATVSPSLEAEAPAATSGESADSPNAAGELGEARPVGEQVPGSLLPTDRALAVSAGVVVATSDIRAAVHDTLTAVQRNGASVYTADVNIGDELDDGTVDGSGYFVVKVPPYQLELLITDLGATVGRLSGRTQDTTDVTDQLVDLDIRIGVERDVIERFRALLGDATALQDIVEIERVISERTIALEQLQASQRNLDDRVERSTLTIELRYEAPVAEVADDAADGIAEAWRSGWDVFVGGLFAVGFVLVVASPFLLLASIVVAVVWLITRARSRRSGRRATADLAAPVGDPASVSSDESLAEPTRPG